MARNGAPAVPTAWSRGGKLAGRTSAVEVIEAIVERNRPLASQADARSLRRTCNGPGGGATGAVEEGLVCQSSDGWAFGCTGAATFPLARCAASVGTGSAFDARSGSSLIARAATTAMIDPRTPSQNV